MKKKRLGWRFCSVGDALYGAFLLVCTGAHWFAAVPIDAARRCLNRFDRWIDDEFNKLFKDW